MGFRENSNFRFSDLDRKSKIWQDKLYTPQNFIQIGPLVSEILQLTPKMDAILAVSRKIQNCPPLKLPMS